MNYQDVRRLALALPGVEDSTSYGTPALKVRGKLLARLKEDGVTLVMLVGFDERELLMAAEPETYFITDHYRGYPSVLVRLETAAPATVARLLEQAWRERAPATLVRAHDRDGTGIPAGAARPPVAGRAGG